MDRPRSSSALHHRVGWLAISLLLVLRIPYSIILTYATADNTGWAPAIFQLATYLLTGFLIWWERDDLRAMHMDAVSVGLVVMFKPVQTLVLQYWGIDTPLTFPHPAGLLIWAASLVLAVALWRNGYWHRRVDRSGPAWLAVGIMIGLLMSALPNLDAFGRATDLVPQPAVTLSTVVAFSYQLGFAASAEEPLFRGFLWGYLRRLGWREAWIWLLQALLFLLAHLYFINALKLQFWILVPAAALIFGVLAWRSRSIAPGMLAHAAYNSGAYIILLNLMAASRGLR